MAKKKEHPEAQIFKDIANHLWNTHIQPFKGKKKSERPGNYNAILVRIERNRRFVKELNELV